MKQDAYRCQDCEWSWAVETGSSRQEVTRGAISHHVETGHEIVFDDRVHEAPSAEPTSGPTLSVTGSGD